MSATLGMESVRDQRRVTCWCCDCADTPDRMVRLSNHPEVQVCLRCAHVLHQRAWQIEDEDKRGPAVLVRARVRALRAAVVRRGWHQSRLLGGVLRRLGRYLP